jgi:mRNA-degrading endonuclease RelE of RelBE toxin-antitoxin system
MASSQRYRLVFAPETLRHLAAIDRRHHALIRRVIQRQSADRPATITRNRKPLEPPAPFDSTWEIRFGPGNCFRVFYEIDQAERTVFVLAIGLKDRNRLWFGAEEYTP